MATGRKRVYRTVGVVPLADEAASGTGAASGFAVTLDGRRARTPGGAALAFPGEALARAVAAEWEAQEEEIRPHAMPLTRLANTAIDRVAGGRDAVVAAMATYAESDLLCYRAEAPRDLVDRQAALWQPLLDWAAEEHGARLAVTAGISPIEQPAAALRALKDAVAVFADLELTALADAAGVAGSIVIALALAADRIGPVAAFEAAQLDETFQNERWGTDAEAARRQSSLRADLEAAAAFIALARR